MFKETQPKTLITWGAKDLKFNKYGAEAYLRDVPNAELPCISYGSFCCRRKTRDIAALILKFLEKNKIE